MQHHNHMNVCRVHNPRQFLKHVRRGVVQHHISYINPHFYKPVKPPNGALQILQTWNSHLLVLQNVSSIIIENIPHIERVSETKITQKKKKKIEIAEP